MSTRRFGSVQSARLGVLAATVGVTLAASVIAAPAASAATGIRGTVTCLSGAAVQGVYVTANSGGSGFATWSAMDGNKATWSKSLPNGGSYYLSVGCGGSRSSWKQTLYGDTMTTTNSTSLCQDVRGQARYGRCF